jgi:hypothetical protein
MTGRIPGSDRGWLLAIFEMDSTVVPQKYLFKILLKYETLHRLVIPAQAGIQASLNWTPAPVYTGAGSARE